MRPSGSPLRVPPELPGADAPPIELPAARPENQAERERAIKKYFPEFSPIGPGPTPESGPTGEPLTLADLQRLALSNSPEIKQATHDVQAARGAAIQSGLPQNPTLGYESDNVNTGLTAGYQGFFVDQVIKTAGKLSLAQNAALMNVLNQEVALRRAQTDLETRVRAGYFAMLVAQENMKAAQALAELTYRTYRVQVELVLAGRAAAYEPFQLQVLALQAREQLATARNRYHSAWKQLSANMGLPGLKPTSLAGRVDMPIPVFQWDMLQGHVLTHHTDVLTARNTVQREQYNLKLARVTPIPDVDARLVVQRDYTTPPNALTYGVQVSIPVPIFDRNQGNILQAQANLLRAEEEEHRVRDQLTQNLADAYERYRNALVQIEDYRQVILPAQVRAYRSIYQRHLTEPFDPRSPTPPPAFGDVVQAQQTLATTITTYVTTLGNLWQAVTDVANLLQTDDLFQLAEKGCVPAVPELPGLSCCHPCSPLPDPALKGGDPHWPDAKSRDD